MLPVKLHEKHIMNGKINKITYPYIKKLVTMNLETDTIMDLHHIMIVIKIHTAAIRTRYPINPIASITSVLAKIHQLLKIFIT